MTEIEVISQQAHSGKGLAAKRHKLTVKWSTSWANHNFWIFSRKSLTSRFYEVLRFYDKTNGKI